MVYDLKFTVVLLWAEKYQPDEEACIELMCLSFMVRRLAISSILDGFKSVTPDEFTCFFMKGSCMSRSALVIDETEVRMRESGVGKIIEQRMAQSRSAVLRGSTERLNQTDWPSDVPGHFSAPIGVDKPRIGMEKGDIRIFTSERIDCKVVIHRGSICSCIWRIVMKETRIIPKMLVGRVNTSCQNTHDFWSSPGRYQAAGSVSAAGGCPGSGVM